MKSYLAQFRKGLAAAASVLGVVVGVGVLHGSAETICVLASAIIGSILVIWLPNGSIDTTNTQGLEDVLAKLGALAATVAALEGKANLGGTIETVLSKLITVLEGMNGQPVQPQNIVPSDTTPPWLAATEAALGLTGSAVTEPALPVNQ